jgi:hypothetical protein
MLDIVFDPTEIGNWAPSKLLKPGQVLIKENEEIRFYSAC